MQANDITLIGDSTAFQNVLDKVSMVAPLNRPVLIIGERGTGKELIAARIHYLSKRWDQEFLKVNCATLTDSLLETELFGHEAGAFTGAAKRHIGRFEQANHGSLFMDELATTTQRLQEKLLRVIEYGEFQRVGSNQTINTDVRIIAATNADLPQLVENNEFRADLLDRLAFDVITLPPLRARQHDILQLANHYALTMAKELHWEYFPGFSETVEQQLLEYHWPGNIRELKNVVERALYQWGSSDDAIDHIIFDPFASPYRPQSTAQSKAAPIEHKPINISGNLKEQIQDYEVKLLKTALSQNQHNQSKTAKALGLSYHQLRGYLRKYKL